MRNRQPLAIKQLFAGMPVSLTHLDISGNGFQQDPVGQFQNVLSEIPASVTSIALDNHHFLPRSELEQRMKMLSTIGFDTHLQTIQSKETDLRRRCDHVKEDKKQPFRDAISAAETLRQELNAAKAAFLTSPQPTADCTKTFVEDCGRHISSAKEILKEHRGWAPFLAKLASLIVSGFTVGIAPRLLGKNSYSLFTPGPTDSETKLNKIESDLGKLREDENGPRNRTK